MAFAGAFYTRFASEIESDPVGDYTRARMVMQEIDIEPDDVTPEDYSSLRHVAHVHFIYVHERILTF